MRDELATVLRLVAEGKLSPDEAAPIIQALTAGAGRARTGDASPPPPLRAAGEKRGRGIRIQVSEHGRRVVDLRVPLSFAAIAARMVPGIPDSYAALIEQAVEGDAIGPIVDTEDENGDGVLISME